MQVDAFLADSAEAVQGKIYALGIGWSTIYATEFPAVHPRVSIGLTIHVPYTATNQPHRLELRLETADGAPMALGSQPGSDSTASAAVTKLAADFNVGRPPLLPAGDAQVLVFAMSVNSLVIEIPEMYNWVIEIDGSEVKRLPMRVQLLTQPGPVYSA